MTAPIEMRTVEAEVKDILVKNKKPPKQNETYRIATLLVEDDSKGTDFICFNDELVFEVGDLKQFQLTKDSYGEKITNVAELSEDMKTLVRANRKEKEPETMAQKEGGTAQLYMTLNGKTYVTQAGLLNEAHKKGLASVETELITFEDKKIAVVKSTVTIKTEEKSGTKITMFTGYGDATPESVNKNIIPHLLRMAETRATNRALRLATNIGMTSIEELGEDK